MAADKPQPARTRPQDPVHPLFFAAHPVLFLYAKTQGGFMFGEVIRPLAVSVGFAILAMAIFRAASRNFQRAAIGLTLFLLFFFSYQRLGDAVHHFANINASVVWVAALIVALVFVAKGRYNTDVATGALNLAGALLVVLVLVQIHTSWKIGNQAIAALPLQQESKVTAPPAGQLPDVYYIILDGYGRPDVLRDIYGEDVSGFTGYLTRKGFYVAPRARSNYAQTMLSLGSSLNMEYLDFLDRSPGEGSRVRLPLFALLRDSEVCRLFRSAGYTVVDFPLRLRGTKSDQGRHLRRQPRRGGILRASSGRNDADSRHLRQGQAAGIDSPPAGPFRDRPQPHHDPTGRPWPQA